MNRPLFVVWFGWMLGAACGMAAPMAVESASATTPLLVATPSPTTPCPVTSPNGNTPPGERASPLHHGNGALWTVLWPGGDVLIEQGASAAGAPLAMKFTWWRGVEGELSIEGRRLDAPAPVLQADVPEGYGQTGFQASGIIFPSEGCWEITGNVADTQLTFVVRVVRIDEIGTPSPTS
jgi:hypothetical protein